MAIFCRSLFWAREINMLRRNIQMSASARAKEALEELKDKNPYFEKYADKIAALQKTSPEEFIDRVEKATNPVKRLQEKTRTYSELLNPKAPISNASSEIPHKKLEDIMKLELIQDKTAEEITLIWLQYHTKKDVLAATLTEAQFDALMAKAKTYPMFLIPLPRSEGFEFIMFQFSANTIHFTPLLAYQVHGENAPECLNIVHYTEMKSKGVILMRGEFDAKVLTAQEAQCLVNQMQLFYCKNEESKTKLLETFTKTPDKFKHMDLVREIENIQLI